jgi:hypothetical protein
MVKAFLVAASTAGVSRAKRKSKVRYSEQFSKLGLTYPETETLSWFLTLFIYHQFTPLSN